MTTQFVTRILFLSYGARLKNGRKNRGPEVEAKRPIMKDTYWRYTEKRGKYYYDHYGGSIEYVIRETFQINEALPFSPFSLIFVKRVSLTG